MFVCLAKAKCKQTNHLNRRWRYICWLFSIYTQPTENALGIIKKNRIHRYWRYIDPQPMMNCVPFWLFFFPSQPRKRCYCSMVNRFAGSRKGNPSPFIFRPRHPIYLCKRIFLPPMKQHINNIPLPIKVVISITITIIAIECDPIKYSVFFVDNQKRLLVQSLLIASFRTLETRTINVRWLLWHVNALSSFTDCCCDSVGPFVLTRQPVRKRKIRRNAFKDI